MDRCILVGRKEIASYTGRSWPKIEEWVTRQRFPAKKIDGIWTSKSDMIDWWLQEKIEIMEATKKNEK